MAIGEVEHRIGVSLVHEFLDQFMCIEDVFLAVAISCLCVSSATFVSKHSGRLHPFLGQNELGLHVIGFRFDYLL